MDSLLPNWGFVARIAYEVIERITAEESLVRRQQVHVKYRLQKASIATIYLKNRASISGPVSLVSGLII